MIWAEGLTKYFDDFLAVDGVSLDVGAGKVLALLGPNGAGKTTTVRMLTSILHPSQGKARVAGFDVVTQADQVRGAVGVLTEHHGLYGRMNAMEYLAFFGELYGLSPVVIRKRADEMLEQFGLAQAKKQRLGQYSKGMRQKLALVRAMLHDPPVLLLDEPTSAMDPESARTVRDAIELLRSKDRTILLCTHNLPEAEELADQIAIIRNGKIIYYDTPGNLKQQLLGAAEFEAKFSQAQNGWLPSLPSGVSLTGQAEKMLRFRVPDPDRANPVLIKQMVNQGLDLISFHEVPRSLEQAYMQAVQPQTLREEHHYAA
jgi:ABC-2 type transport system ATP-binding protein